MGKKKEGSGEKLIFVMKKSKRRGKKMHHTFQASQHHAEVSLAFFSTFVPVDLTPYSFMQRQGVPIFYDSASCAAISSLYICHVEDVLGRVPKILCFVAGRHKVHQNSSCSLPNHRRFSSLMSNSEALTKFSGGLGL